jgi:hypothetical protein
MTRKSIIVRATVSIELAVTGENWDDQSSIEQVHREGAKLAVDRINKLCERYVKIVGTPKIEAVIVEKDR